MFSLKNWFLALMVVFFSGAAIAELSPDEVVKKTADDVISAIKSDKDIQAGNKKAIYALVESKILPSFDFNKICRLVMGKNWRKMSAEQKEEFSSGFKMLLLRTYAVALSKYTDQKITVLPMKKQKGSIVTVKTEITGNAITGAGVFKFGDDQENFYLKAGMHSWDLDGKVTASLGSSTAPLGTGTDLTFGAGFKANNWFASYDYYAVEEGDFSSFGIGYSTAF